MWGHREKGDEKSFRRDALAHVDALHNFARHLAGSDADAEDLVQETYARAFASAPDMGPDSNLKSWLFRILRNLFIDGYRRRSTSPIAALPFDESVEIGTASLEPFDTSAITSTDLQAALSALPEASRTVILLDLEGMNEGEVAEILGCAMGTVKSRLFRARAALRASLKDYAPRRSAHGL